MHVAERLVRVLVCVTDYTVADLYLVKNFHLHKITDKRKKLLGLLVWSIIHLQVQHRWKTTFLFLVFYQNSPQDFNCKIGVMFYLFRAPKVQRAKHMNNCTK